jgi:signal transduction histidine kinase
LRSRAKPLLTFALLFLAPLLAVTLLNFLANLKFEESILRSDLNNEVGVITNSFDFLLWDRDRELVDLATNPAVRRYVNDPAPNSAPAAGGTAAVSPAKELAPARGQGLAEVRDLVAARLRDPFYASIAVFAPNKRLLFVAEPPRPQGNGEAAFLTSDFLSGPMQPDETVWTTAEQQPRCRVVPQAALGKTLRCTLPILVSAEQPEARGALVADLKIDSLVGTVARRSELRLSGQDETSPRSHVLVLDESGTIVYHTNDAHKHQPVSSSLPYFAHIAAAMTAGQFGTAFYTSSTGDKWLASYAPLGDSKLSLAVARNYSQLTANTRRLGWLSLVLVVLLGGGVAVLTSHYYLKRIRSIDRVAAGVGAIAKGELDHRIELQSSDQLRPLADNLSLMTKQLRDQIAREAETRQFQSFVRLSAILTHDLKNAIEALSLTVANMERHFDNPEFRADAMKSVTGATDNLRALVARLSNPVVTLSGEHKRPQPVDLVPMLREVCTSIAGLARPEHEVSIELPERLYALVDGERLRKVVENLIINALEAMNRKPGLLTVLAGTTADGKPCFSVSDTGAGISEEFIEEKLFHPFATTKRQGVGLGLYTCREVVVANGGSITVSSQQGVGTTFTVVLPSAAPGHENDK